MKKILTYITPLSIFATILLIVSIFLRYYLVINSEQLIREFKNQNYREIYSLDTLGVSSKLNSLSGVINWVCIKGSVGGQDFYKMEKSDCRTSLFKHQQILKIPEANNTIISFTLRLPKEVEFLFGLFWITECFLIFVLIQATRKSEEEKRVHQLKINKLARQMSHDIRSPLATLNTILSEANNFAKEDYELLKKSIKQINKISNSLLSEKNGALEEMPLPKLEEIQIVKILEEIIEEKKVEYKKDMNVTFSLKVFSKELLVCLLDEVEFKRSISNLVNNSVEAAQNKHSMKIEFEISVRDRKVEIKLQDNGMGISKELLEKIGTCEFTTKKYGNGLGLIHAIESVKNWNGTVKIESGIGQGTKITIVLPFVYKEATIILIDNDELVRLTWQSRAKKKGIHLVLYKNSEQLKLDLSDINSNSIFYIDSELDEEKGEDVAEFLYRRGFINLNICSGYEKNEFKHLAFIQNVVGKAPPF